MTEAPTPLARALGRLPTGLYVVTTKTPEGPLGFVASFVMQAAFQPPTLSVAIAAGRPHLEAIRSSRVFGVSILDEASSGLMGPFFKKDTRPFDDVEHTIAPAGSAVLSGALAWMECRLCGEHDAGDHVIVFGEVQSGELLREAEPSVRVRTSGLEY